MYEFTNNWFTGPSQIWDQLIPKVAPATMLEVGSYEGASACYLIRNCGNARPITLHCVDTWKGSIEHIGQRMEDVEARFHRNTTRAIENVRHPVDLMIHKDVSQTVLCRLVTEGMVGAFDLIYIDGSHQAPDVLTDAVLAFQLLRVNGLLIFDDYLWSEPNLPAVDPIRCPKIAIDAFTSIYCRKIKIISAPLRQLYLQKIAD